MSLALLGLKILAMCGGIIAILFGTIKEYQKIKKKSHKQCFLFYILAVLLLEISLVWGIIFACSGFSGKVGDLAIYMVFGWALACFSFSAYVFTDSALNGDVSKKDKFEGKVAIAFGIYLTWATFLSLTSW